MGSCFKKDQSKKNLLTNINTSLMVGKSIRGGICHFIYRYATANNGYMRNYDKNKESSYLQYWDINIIGIYLYGWAMLQRLPMYNFVWIE